MEARLAPTQARRVGAVLFVVLSLAGCPAGAAEPGSPELIDDPVYAKAQRLVEIEPGRSLNLHCSGTGSPTVVFEHGLGNEVSSWGFVQPAIARRSRACSYDRAGLGFSSPARRPGTSANAVDDLHRLLAAADIRPPYLLVGHSYGGMNVRLFASRFPREVLGMVLVDTSHEDYQEEARTADPRRLSRAEWSQQVIEPELARQRACVAGARAGFQPGSELVKACTSGPSRFRGKSINDARGATQLTPAWQEAVLWELESIRSTSITELRESSRKLGAMPLVVLNQALASGPLSPPDTEEARRARFALWVKLQDDLASLSSRGERRTIANAGHYIGYDQPRAVIDAIVEVLEAARR